MPHHLHVVQLAVLRSEGSWSATTVPSRAIYTQNRILYCDPYIPRRHCGEFKAGIIRSRLPVRVTSRATEHCTIDALSRPAPKCCSDPWQYATESSTLFHSKHCNHCHDNYIKTPTLLKTTLLKANSYTNFRH